MQNSAQPLDVNDRLLASLNPQQHEAVVTLDNALLVLSGAGTGKTKVLTTKIAYIIENGYAFPSQILAVTFSNRAAREMKERLLRLASGVGDVWLGTFHSICARILRSHSDLVGISGNFTIIDVDDQSKVVGQILKEINLDKKIANGVVSKISRWKDKGITSDDARVDASSLEGRIYKIYQERIASYDSVDFGDLLLYVAQIFRKHPEVLQKYRQKFRFILVDEYQDTNMSQYIWLRMLSPLGVGLCCVGDDDQAIYSWRGAEVGNILRFEKDFQNTRVIRLEKNYRSVGNILEAASSLIANNENRLGKTIWTDGEKGDKVLIRKAYNGFEEAKIVVARIDDLCRNGVPYGEMAVLVRAGFQTREFEERFLADGIPYRIIGGLKFYDRQEIKDIIAYLRLIYQPNDSLAFERIINVPRRGIGASAVAGFHAHARRNNVSLFQAAKEIAANGLLRPVLRSSLQDFVHLLESLRQSDVGPADLAKIILDKTGYLKQLTSEQTIEAQTRVENIRELLRALEDFDSLGEFIEHASLVVDANGSSPQDLVTIMTLHSAKGAEFEAVFLVGWEEGVFPHNLSLSEGNIEEERRLAYVGVTRAKKYALITYAVNRRIYNQWQTNLPSRFLAELSSRHTGSPLHPVKTPIKE
ncbi:MAG: UvrD-helicase domain-containing protein [Holosporaceae bacterium]|jgi:DNA helicase-2/ATP-dependent DNA helicase PcrA|nr:UvrD-helicase domain-containing protein [Holosporaceae bacterium]